MRKRVKPRSQKGVDLRARQKRSRKRKGPLVRSTKPREQVLGSSHALLQAVIEGATDAIFVKDLHGRYLMINSVGAGFIGKPVEDIIGKDDRALFTPEIARHIMEKDRHFLTAGGTETFEEVATAGDITRTYLTTKSACRDQEGRVIGLIGTARDITERKWAEEEYERLTRKIWLLLESTGEGIYGIDLQGRCTFINKAAGALLGYRPEDLVGKNMHQIHHHARQDGSPYPVDDCLIYRVFRNGQGCRVDDEVFWRQDGTAFPVEYSSYPILENGTINGAVVTFADIAERKRVEQALRESEERFRSAFGHAPIGMALVSPDGRFLLVNRALCQTVGYSEPELLATTFQAVTHPDDLEADLTHVRQMLAGEIPCYQMEKRYFHKLGHAVWVLKNVSLVHDGHGKPLYFVVHIQDITDRKQTEEDLQQREEQLWSMLGKREQLSQDLHDNIIQKIYAIGLNLEEGKQLLAEDSRVTAGNLERAIADLNTVIRDVRNYISGIEHGTISATRLRTELAELVRVTKSSQSPRFRLRLDPMAVGRLNPEEAKQILFIVREALTNSFRHSLARTGFVSLRTEQGQVRLEVADNGVGFDGLANESSGHGLRNMAARAQKLGGRLEVIAAPGQGTRIIVEIPQEQIYD